MNLLDKLYKQANKKGVSKSELMNEYYGNRNVSLMRKVISVILYNETALPFTSICNAVGYKQSTNVLEHVRCYRDDVNFKSDVSNFYAESLLSN